jgi:dihydrofolate reductase
MLADDFVDVLHLFTYPVTLGAGPRLFHESAAPMKLTRSANASYENAVVYLGYRLQR